MKRLALATVLIASHAAAQPPAPEPPATGSAPAATGSAVPPPAPAPTPLAPAPTPPAPAPTPAPLPPPAAAWDAPARPAPPPPAYPPRYPYAYPMWGPAQPPRVLPAVEGRAPPPGYRAEERLRRGMVIGGSVTFGVLYLATLVAAAFMIESDDGDRFAPMFAPVVGPFITIGTANPTAVPTFLLALDGVTQALGLGLLIGGVLYPEDVWVREDGFGMMLGPVMIPGAPAGVGLTGRF